MARRRPNHTPARAPRPAPPAPQPAKPPAAPVPWAPLLVCGIALLLRAIQLVLDWRNNPFATQPIEDAEVYWNWAGEIARGKLIGDTPFFSAPLYPYLLGIVRALGGGLPVVYSLQLLAYVSTLYLLSRIALRRFGPVAAWLAPLLYALLSEPAYFTGRILTPTLQALLIVGLLYQLSGGIRGLRWALATGILLGLNVLANPPALLLVPALAAWIALGKSDPPRGIRIRRAAVVLAAAILTIAPATVHNALANRELILVSAQSGITFAQGNAAAADGTYTAIPGIDQSRLVQNLSAARLFERETGAKGTWSAVDRHLRDKGVHFWRENPLDALKLSAAKLWWFISGTNYGDIYAPPLEAAAGLAPAAWLAPLPTPFLIPAALFGLLAVRTVRRNPPEWLFVALGVFVVVVFYYSPRYRFPAVPALTLLASGVLSQLVAAGATWSTWRIAGVATAALGPLAILGINSLAHFDQPARYEGQFQNALANVLTRGGDDQRAAAVYRSALDQRPNNAALSGGLATVLARQGKPAEALATLEPALRAHPDDATLHSQLAYVLIQLDRTDEALNHMRQAVQLNPDDARLHNNLASALLRQGQNVEARIHAEAALRLRPDYAEAMVNLAQLEFTAGHVRKAVELCEKAVRISPRLSAAWQQLGDASAVLGDYAGAIAALRQALALSPQNPELAFQLAWWLAVAPGITDADRKESLRLAQALAQRAPNDYHVQDALAAALAANDQFPAASQAVRRAIEIARAASAPELGELESRQALYAAGKPYVIMPTTSQP